jgi:hypothetical protein
LKIIIDESAKNQYEMYKISFTCWEGLWRKERLKIRKMFESKLFKDKEDELEGLIGTDSNDFFQEIKAKKARLYFIIEQEMNYTGTFCIN